MLQSPVSSWRQSKEAPVSYIGISVLMFFYRWLGRGFCRFCIAVVVAVAYPFLGKARRASATYRRVWSDYTGRRFPGGGYRHVLSFAYTMADRMAIWQNLLKISPIPEENLGDMESSRQLYEARKGCFMLTAHLGNYELMHAYYANRGCGDEARIHAYMDMKVSRQFNDLLNSVSERRSVCLHSIENMGVASAMEMLQRIEQGDLLIMTGDRGPAHAGKSTVVLPFLGKPAVFPKGVARCAAMLKCPVYSFFVAEEKGQYHLHCYRLSDGSADAESLRRNYIMQLERMLVRYPLSWFNFYPFWV